MSKLTCKDLCVEYFGYDDVICGFSAEFSDGFNVVFAGEQSGKTTLLKALAGVISSKGDIFYDEINVRDLSLRERDFAMVFDDYALFERHSVRYNLEYPLKLRKVPKERRDALVSAAAALFDLDVMIDASVYKLKAWHKVALALCRAYIRNARVTFIDNVFSRLDLQTRREAFYRFMPLFSGRGVVVYATDSIEEAAFLSKEMYYLNCGYLLQKGSVDDICNAPACMAAFIAFNDHATVIPATVMSEGVSVLETRLPFDVSRLIGENYVGKEVLLGIRPQDAEIVEDGIPATVSGRFFKEGGYIYALSAFGTTIFVASDAAFSIGGEVNFAVRKVFSLFDVTNERAIVRY